MESLITNLVIVAVLIVLGIVCLIVVPPVSPLMALMIYLLMTKTGEKSK